MLFCQSFTFAEAHEKFALFSENSNFSRKSRSCTESSIFVNVLVIHSSFVLLHECLCLLSNDSSYNVLCQSFMLLVCTCVKNQK